MRRLVAAAAILTACAGASPATTTLPPPGSTTTRPPGTTTTSIISSTTVTTGAATTVAPTTTSTTTTTSPPLVGLAYETVLTGGLDQPVGLALAPGDDLVYIVERRGLIRVFDPAIGSLVEEPFADLRSVVGSAGIEMGLLGLAFHPDYASNGRLFVYYTAPSTDSRLVRLERGPDGTADIESLVELIVFPQPTDRHNAGMLQFGPDGYLWVSLGEGGKASVHSQDPTTLLSAILRIDVDGASYAIPPDNPFVTGVGGAPEVWAYGLRNPWRFSIDAETRTIWIADVGQAEWEEIDAVSIDDHVGHNFGWLPMEGFECFLAGCDSELYTSPVAVYPHSEGCSVTGGHVYRGDAIPELKGHYLYSDWCTGFLRSIVTAGDELELHDWTDLAGVPGQVTAFGVDPEGETLVVTWEGDLHRIVPIR